MAKTTGADKVQAAMRTYTVRYAATCRGVLEEGAQTVKARMKAEHRWQNRTGAAEANLDAEVFDAPGGANRLVAFHGVPYGKELETIQAGRFAVLQPTLRSEWPRILARLRARLNELGGGGGAA